MEYLLRRPDIELKLTSNHTRVKKVEMFLDYRIRDFKGRWIRHPRQEVKKALKKVNEL